MADPTLMSDTPNWLGDWAWKALTGLIGLLGVDTMRRTRRLELTTKTNESAMQDRAELKAEIAAQGQRSDAARSLVQNELQSIVTKIEAHRLEQKADTQKLEQRMDTQHGRLFTRIDELADLIRQTRG